MTSTALPPSEGRRSEDGEGGAARTEAPLSTPKRRRAATPQEIHDRLALFSVRAVFFFVAATLGFFGTDLLADLTNRPDLTATKGVLMACGIALLVTFFESRFSRSPVRTISAITFGLIIGFVLSLVLQSLVGFIVEAVSPVEVQWHDRFKYLPFLLQLVTTTLLCYFSVTILLQTKDDFKFIIPYVEFRKDVKSGVPLIVDTSCFVDGRIQALLATNVLDNRLVVPKCVLEELQGLADSSHRATRERGRRGLDILREIERSHYVDITDDPVEPGQDVDAALVALATAENGKLITTDYNLQKNATLQGLTVLNVNDIATALKPSFVPGDALTVRLLREGDEREQAVGFLSDGTMVVVEEARQSIGGEVTIEVTSSLQTQAGKMVFGRLCRPSAGASA